MKQAMEEEIKFRAPKGTYRRLRRVAKLITQPGRKPLSPADVVREAIAEKVALVNGKKAA